MAIVRLEALNALAALIQAAIPGLECLCTGVAPPSEQECYPNLSLQPTRWTFEPEQAMEARELPGNVQVWNVGQFSSPIVMSLVTANLQDRWNIEAKILDLFLSSRHPLTGMHRPGIIVLPVVACTDLGDWLASFELETDEWSDTAAFDRRYESRMVITGIIPALTVERPVYTINELQLGITPDMSTTFTPQTFSPPIEIVIINQDGTLASA